MPPMANNMIHNKVKSVAVDWAEPDALKESIQSTAPIFISAPLAERNMESVGLELLSDTTMKW